VHVTDDPTDKSVLAAIRRKLREIVIAWVPQRFWHRIRDPEVLKPMEEMTFNADGYTFIRFPMEPGRIQVCLAGSQPTDEGTVRLEFGTLVRAPDDWFVIKASSDKTEYFDLNSDQFPPLPPLPDP
jgi:hypothetical protein